LPPFESLRLTNHTADRGKSEPRSAVWLVSASFEAVAGILTDAFPLFRIRRRHYLLISAGLASASWIGMIILPHRYGALLWGAMTVNLFMVMASTVTGAFLVEAGQSLGATGRLTALL
jgi:BT1 family